VTLTPVADIANGSLDLSAKVQLKTSDNLPAMSVSYIGLPGSMTEIVDSNALQSYLGLKVLERSLDELERLQREQQRAYEEEERARKEDEARLDAYYAQRREMETRARELKVHRVNQEIQAERARAEAERVLKVYQAMIRPEMTIRVRELRVHRRMAAERQKALDKLQRDQASDEAAKGSGEEPSGEAVRIPLPRAKSNNSSSTAATDAFQPLVLVPPAAQAPEPEKFDLLDIFTMPSSNKKWLKRREETR
jgi:hypothetical protein